jgi:glucose-6-phosphate isomerase
MIRLDYKNVLAEQVGEKDGLTQGELEKEIVKGVDLIRRLNEKGTEGAFVFRKTPYDKEVLQKIGDYAEGVRKKYKFFVHVGIGGSALGAIAVCNALRKPREKSPRMYFLDNIDPDETSAVLNRVDFKHTKFHFASKSGDTAETLATFLVVLHILKNRLGKKYKENLVISTNKTKGFLRRFAETEGIEAFEIPEGIAGRFSVFTSACLLPIAVFGVDIGQLISGAISMDKLCSKADARENIAYLPAVINYLLDAKKGKNILVTMPYAGALVRVVDWFGQIWAESLGKRFGLDGKEVFSGQTPVRALGTTDQHSQIQLYNEGPNNKVIAFIEVEKWENDIDTPQIFENEKSVEILQGRTLGEIMKAAKYGTEFALTQNRRPNYTLKFDRISPKTLGELLFMFQMETVFAGMLYNVNPFDQPGVDAGKRAMVGDLEKKGSRY